MAKKNDENNESQFTLTLKLKTLPYQEKILEKRFNLLTELYDDIQVKLLRIYHYVRQTREYKDFIKQRTEEGKGRYANEEFFKKWKREDGFSFTDKGFTYLGKKFNKNPKYSSVGINSVIVNSMLKTSYAAWEGKLKDDKVKIKLKRKTNSSVNSYNINGGSTNKNGVRNFVGMKNLQDVKTDNIIHIIINGGRRSKAKYIDIPFKVKTPYELFAFGESKGTENINNVRICRKMIYGNWKYFVQFGILGQPYQKGREIGEGRVGLDLAPNGVAVYGENGFLYKHSPKTNNKVDENQLAKLQVEVDRIRRINNPLRYNEDGTTKSFRGCKKENIPQWVHSKKECKLASQISEMHRKAARKRKLNNIELANTILQQGNVFNVEKNPVKEWQAKSKGETTINEKTGLCNSKKRFGKSILSFAPSEFVEILEKKIKFNGGVFNEIDCKNAATQFDHTSGTYTKHELSERKITLNDGETYDRDIISAFNIAFNSNTIQNKSKKEEYKDNYDVESMKLNYPLFKEQYKKMFII